MRYAFLHRLAVIVALALASPAIAQNYGPQPSYQPQLGYQPQPGYGPQGGPAQPGGASPIVGTWSGTATGTNGQVQVAAAYGPDGTFVNVGRLSNGFIVRFWGIYRLSPTGPGQFRLETQLQGWLPRETCQQVAGNQPQCQPMQFPTSDQCVARISHCFVGNNRGIPSIEVPVRG